VKPPAVHTVPPGAPFADAIAAGALDMAGGDPLALSHITVLLPTRRSVRALQEAFLRRSEGRALLLPRLQPLGDLDADELAFAAGAEAPEEGGAGGLELSPAITPLRRQLLLAALLRAAPQLTGTERTSADQAARLAAELARFLDQVQTEGLTLDRLDALVPEGLAEHWQKTVEFLAILREHWPRILKAEGCIDPATRRNLLLHAQAEAWRDRPPEHPVIAAGSTGSIPATAALLSVVARLPRGAVVLPGLDCEADEATWHAILGDAAHPQHGMALLLRHLEVERTAVSLWPGVAALVREDTAMPIQARARIAAAALRPAEAVQAWRADAAALGAEDARSALSGVRRIDCPGPQEEAGVIALMLREALEKPNQRAALVTADRSLARRVAAELGRWDIAIDDSAGRPLVDTPPGAFLRLIAEAMAEDVAPIMLLAMLKHPLAAGGHGPVGFRRTVRRLERFVLRGIAPAPGFAGLFAALEERAASAEDPAARERDATRADELRRWLEPIAQAAAPFVSVVTSPEAPLADLLARHVALAEWLAATHSAPGPARLWATDAGEAAARFVAELAEAAKGWTVSGAEYAALFSSLLGGVVVRPRYGAHPRLAIWGPLEARLQQTDLLILGGLNEGTWPPEPVTDPWLSRPMRAAFGLPPPERRIGLSAHDFAQGFCAPRVVLTRAQRAEGAPTVPSRWLLRLDGFLALLDIDIRGDAPRWLGWQVALDQPAAYEPIRPPEPRPPFQARPRRLRVTAVETWMRDPYAIYAEHILKLKPLDDIGAEVSAAERGRFVHAALDTFLREIDGGWPEDALERLLAAGRAAFGIALERPTVQAFWWPRFERVARWFVAQEGERRGSLIESLTEIAGELVLHEPARGTFTIRAKADRIDRLGDGTLAIIDYKTGALPSQRETMLGIAAQLPLEALMAERGAFGGVGRSPVTALEHWWLNGRGEGGTIRPVADPDVATAEAEAGLLRLIDTFDDPATPYHSQPVAGTAPRYSAYAHLARVSAWATAMEDDAES
jgi:ATP-dependent helicase/nuclease subunit B